MLNQSVLVLNRSWLAIHVCDVKRALTLLALGFARVVTEEFETHDFHSWRELSQYARDNYLDPGNHRADELQQGATAAREVLASQHL
jgi:hypothetical protein